MGNKKILSWFFVLLILAGGCQRKGSAEAVLKDFVSYRFSQNQTRERLLAYTSGELRREFESLETEEFAQLLKSTPYRLRSFRVVNSNCGEAGRCYITYTLRYNTYKQGEQVFMTEVKKIAELIKEGESWKISNVDNIKTYHDSKEEIAP